MWRVIGCLGLVLGLLVAASVITAGILAVGNFLGRAVGVSTWEAAVLIVIVAGGLLWLVNTVVGPAWFSPAWFPDVGLEEADWDEDEAPAAQECSAAASPTAAPAAAAPVIRRSFLRSARVNGAVETTQTPAEESKRCPW